MNVLGFDPSLTCSGFSYCVGEQVHTGTIQTRDLRGPERLDFILKSVTDLCFNIRVLCGTNLLVAMEGYAMGAPKAAGRAFDIGELGGILKHHFWSEGISVLLVPPTNLKMFATTKGNAKKPEVVQSIADRWGYSIRKHDEADAFVLMKMGEAYANLRSRRGYDDKRRQALTKCSVIGGVGCNRLQFAY